MEQEKKFYCLFQNPDSRSGFDNSKGKNYM